ATLPRVGTVPAIVLERFGPAWLPRHVLEPPSEPRRLRIQAATTPAIRNATAPAGPNHRYVIRPECAVLLLHAHELLLVLWHNLLAHLNHLPRRVLKRILLWLHRGP